MRLDEKLSALIASQLPEHISRDKPRFIAFLKAYYEYVEQELNPQELLQNTLKYDDIDQTLDSFVEYFIKQYYDTIPRNLLADKRALVKHVKSLWQTKGSPRSYELLFQLLYNKEIDIFYPGERILRASDGKWIRNVSILLKIIHGNEDEIINKLVFIRNETSENKIKIIRKKFAENLYGLDEPIFEYFVDDRTNIPVNIGDFIEYGEFKAEVVAIPVKVDIVRGGRDFHAGDILTLKSGLGYRSKVKVLKVDENGSVKAVQLISFGTNYDTDFYNYFSPNNKDLPKSTYDLDEGDLDLTDDTNGFVDEGFIYRYGYAEPDYFAEAYEGTILRWFRTDTSITSETQLDFTATGSINDLVLYVYQGAQARYPGYYKNNDGFLDDDIFLQNYHYYQPFSYVIRVDEDLRNYKKAIIDNLHPAGTKLFGEYLLSNNIETIVSIFQPSEFHLLELESNASQDDNVVYVNFGKNVDEDINTDDTQIVKDIDYNIVQDVHVEEDIAKEFITEFDDDFDAIDEFAWLEELIIYETDFAGVEDYIPPKIITLIKDEDVEIDENIGKEYNLELITYLGEQNYFANNYTSPDYSELNTVIIDEISFLQDILFHEETDVVEATDEIGPFIIDKNLNEESIIEEHVEKEITFSLYSDTGNYYFVEDYAEEDYTFVTGIIDELFYDTEKTFVDITDSADAIDEISQVEIFLNKDESIETEDALDKEYGLQLFTDTGHYYFSEDYTDETYIDIRGVIDEFIPQIIKTFIDVNDTIDIIDEQQGLFLELVKEDSTPVVEDDVYKDGNIYIDEIDSAIIEDAVSKNIINNIEETIESSDNAEPSYGLFDEVIINDSISFDYTMNVIEITTIDDNGQLLISDYDSELYFLEDYVANVTIF